MKHLPLFVPLLLLYFFHIACKKNNDITPAARNNNIIMAASNSAPAAYAGLDLEIELPLNEVTLAGSFFDKENNFKNAEWTKLSGPDSCLIENSHSLQTKVRRLKEGVYEFELTVTDAMDLYGNDTVIVTVAKKAGTPASDTSQVIIGTNEIIFTNLQWIFPWYPSLEVKNIYSYVSPSDSIKVFIQRDNAPGWVEVPFISSWPNYNYGPYEYVIESRPDGAGMYNFGSLYVFFYEYYGGGIGVNDTPDIKIVH